MGTLYRRMVFDGRAVDAQDPEGKRRLPCEDEKHGQTTTCPACGSRFGTTWWIKFYRAGRPFFESARSSKKRVAEDLLKAREGQVVDGRFVGTRADKVRIDDLAADFVNDYKINGRRSLNKAECNAARLKALFGNRRAVEITTTDVRAYIAMRQAGKRDDTGAWITKPAAAATIQQELAALRRMFNLALQAGELYHAPHIPSLKLNNVRTGFYSEVDFLALHEALPAYLRPVAAFAYTLGWRKGEILPLTWDRVDLSAGTVRLDPGTTKNDEGWTVYLTPGLRAVLRAQWEQTCALVRKVNPEATVRAVAAAVPWVFHRSGRPIKDIRGAWRKACTAAGPPGRIPHDFRRTAVRNMERIGVARSVAMKTTGHKTESIYRRHAIVSDGDLREAAAKLEVIGGGLPVTEFVTVPSELGLDSAQLQPNYGEPGVGGSAWN